MRSLTTLILCLAVYCCPITGKKCVKIDQCSCKFDDGSGTVDLSTVGVKGGGALVKDQKSEWPGDYVYSFNPCYGFDEGESCKNAAGCQVDKARGIEYLIGDVSQVMFEYDGENVTAVYSSDDGLGTTRKMPVTLVCDKTATTPKVRIIGEFNVRVYFFVLTSAEVCPRKTTTVSTIKPRTTPSTRPSGPSVVTVTSPNNPGIYININNNVNILTGFLMGMTVLGVGALLYLFACGKQRIYKHHSSMKV